MDWRTKIELSVSPSFRATEVMNESVTFLLPEVISIILEYLMPCDYCIEGANPLLGEIDENIKCRKCKRIVCLSA